MAKRNPAEVHATRWGLMLFGIYVVLYTGFILLSAFWPELMRRTTPLGSVNLAIMYGMGLILAALLLALVYLFMTGRGPQGEPHERS